MGVEQIWCIFSSLPGGVAQSTHGFERRIEQGKEQEREIIFGNELAARVLLGGAFGCLSQVWLQALAKLLEQFPAPQLFFFHWRDRRYHAISKASMENLYKLQLCYSQFTDALQASKNPSIPVQHFHYRTELEIFVKHGFF